MFDIFRFIVVYDNVIMYIQQFLKIFIVTNTSYKLFEFYTLYWEIKNLFIS